MEGSRVAPGCVFWRVGPMGCFRWQRPPGPGTWGGLAGIREDGQGGRGGGLNLYTLTHVRTTRRGLLCSFFFFSSTLSSPFPTLPFLVAVVRLREGAPGAPSSAQQAASSSERALEQGAAARHLRRGVVATARLYTHIHTCHNTTQTGDYRRAISVVEGGVHRPRVHTHDK